MNKRRILVTVTLIALALVLSVSTVLALGVKPRPAEHKALAQLAEPCQPGNAVDSGFFTAVRDNMGISDSGFAQTAFRVWQGSENTIACFNPLATTLAKPGSTRFNAAGVQNYPDQVTGIAATAETLVFTPNGTGTFYAPIRNMLAQRAFDAEALRIAVATWTFGPALAAAHANDAFVVNIVTGWEAAWNARPVSP